MRTYHVYIMASISRKLYIGITGDLWGRVAQHKDGTASRHTARYKNRKLVYHEEFASPTDAIRREKQLKGWRREKKVWLLERENPAWRDLAGDCR